MCVVDIMNSELMIYSHVLNFLKLMSKDIEIYHLEQFDVGKYYYNLIYIFRAK